MHKCTVICGLPQTNWVFNLSFNYLSYMIFAVYEWIFANLYPLHQNYICFHKTKYKGHSSADPTALGHSTTVTLCCQKARLRTHIKAVDKCKGHWSSVAPPFTKLAVMAILMYLGVRIPRAHMDVASRVYGAFAWSPPRAWIRPCMVTAHTSAKSFGGRQKKRGREGRVALTFPKSATVTCDKTKG